MGLLDTDILSNIFGAAFAGIYGEGALHATGLVGDGEGGWTESGNDTPIKVQIDAATQRMMAEPGYIGTDVRLLILSDTIADITTDMEVTARGKRYMVMSVARDPAHAYFECRGRLKNAG